jgi:hypothetical protein
LKKNEEKIPKCCGTVLVEARLPNAAVVRCNAPIPLSLKLKRGLGSAGIFYLESIDITLGMTSTKVKGITYPLKSQSAIFAKSNLRLALGAEEHELSIDPAALAKQNCDQDGGIPATLHSTLFYHLQH